MGQDLLLLSVVVVVRNQGHALRRQLDALQAHLAARALTHELVVVDNGSTDATAGVLQDLTGPDGLVDLQALVLSAPVAPAAAAWAGVARAAGDVVATLPLGDDAAEQLDAMWRKLDADVDVVLARANPLAAPTRHGRKGAALPWPRAAAAWLNRPAASPVRHRLLRRRVVNDLARRPAPETALHALSQASAWTTAQASFVAPAAPGAPRGVAAAFVRAVRVRVRRGRGPLRWVAWALAAACVANLGRAGYFVVAAALGRALQPGWAANALLEAATLAVLAAGLATASAYLGYARSPFGRPRPAELRASYASLRVADGPAPFVPHPPPAPPPAPGTVPPTGGESRRAWADAPFASPH